MLSESTARLVEDRVVLGEREIVHIKGVDAGVPARRLLAADRRAASKSPARVPSGRTPIGEGRHRRVTGPGRSRRRNRHHGDRTARCRKDQVGPRVGRDGDAVVVSRCSSPTANPTPVTIPLHVVSRLLRAIFGIVGLTPEEARARVRSQDPRGRRGGSAAARRPARHLRRPRVPTSLRTPGAVVSSSSSKLFRWPARAPAIYVVEDAQWIDSVSEIAAWPASRRRYPECGRCCSSYTGPSIRGRCRASPAAHPFTLAPLSDSHIAELIKGLLGERSVGTRTVDGDRRPSGGPTVRRRGNRARSGRAGRTRG